MKGKGTRYEDVKAALARPRRRGQAGAGQEVQVRPQQVHRRGQGLGRAGRPGRPDEPGAQPARRDLGLPAGSEVTRTSRAGRRAPAHVGAGPPDAVPARHAGLLRIREAMPAWLSWLLGLIPIAGAARALGRRHRRRRPRSGSSRRRSCPRRSRWCGRSRCSGSSARSPATSSSPSRAWSRASRSRVAIAFPLGLLMGSFTKVKAAFTPLSVFGAYLPIPTLVPLTLSLFGTGELQKVMFLALAFVDLPAAADRGGGRRRRRRLPEDRLHPRARRPAQAVQQGAAADRLARHLPGAAPRLRRRLELHPPGRDGRHRQGLGGIIIISQRRGPREHIYLVLLVDRRSSPSSPTSSGPRSAAALPLPGGASDERSPCRRGRRVPGRHQDLQPGDAARVHRAQGRHLRGRGQARTTASSSPIVGPSGCGKSTILNLIQGFADVYPPTDRRGAGARPAGRRARAATAA